MSKKSWSLYDPKTGLFLGRTIGASRDSGHDEYLRAVLPAGTAAMEGVFDHLCQRVDVASGKVVGYQPPQPSSDHEWNATDRRWAIRADVTERQQRRAQALARIAALEAAQHRAVREILLKVAPDEAKRLAEIEGEITALRGRL